MLNPYLGLAHAKSGGKLEKDLHKNPGAGAAAAHLVETFIVVDMANQLVEDLELEGLLESSVHEILDRRRGDRVGGMDHEADAEQRSEGVEVKTPGLMAKPQFQSQGRGHQ